MKKYLLFIFILLTGFITSALADTSEQIYFLAMDLPQDTDQSIVNDCQIKIRELIKKNAPEYTDKILYHTPDNIHISLIRFNEIHPDALLRNYIQLFKNDARYLPDRNIANKIRDARLNVTHTGFIVYEFPEPVTLTKFVNILLNDLKKNKLYYKDSDFNEGGKIYPHFSVGYFNPNEVSVDTMKEILKGKVSAPKCNSFRLNEFILMHSEKLTKPLTYSRVYTFKKPK
ncbi:MAG TPA: hypothetical protein DD381_10505 [Lentisphaeria bacterium]|nr:MAG: hypothetical protein A2X47_02165 [Lentisphaerae bacterium GWF2_38_69]HBM16757.1 hypothetical protein [Lentisphaeria bacterium]